MENRYLPILHENIFLSVLRVSNESLFSWDEWVVKILLNPNYFLLLVMTVTIWQSAESIHPSQKYRYGRQVAHSGGQKNNVLRVAFPILYRINEFTFL